MPDGVLSIEPPSSYETTLDVKMEWRLYPSRCLKYNASDYQNNNKHVTSIMDASCCSSESFPSDVIRMRSRKLVQGGDGWTAVKRLQGAAADPTVRCRRAKVLPSREFNIQECEGATPGVEVAVQEGGDLDG